MKGIDQKDTVRQIRHQQLTHFPMCLRKLIQCDPADQKQCQCDQGKTLCIAPQQTLMPFDEQLVEVRITVLVAGDGLILTDIFLKILILDRIDVGTQSNRLLSQQLLCQRTIRPVA